MELKGHAHSVGRGSCDRGMKCDACHQSYHGNTLFCIECDFTVHERCGFVFIIQDALSEHPSHVGHSLKLLTTGAPDHTDPKCHICGKITKRLLYHCSTCDLNLDIGCMLDAMSSRAHLNMPWHHHPLLMLDVGKHKQCVLCGLPGEYGYWCPRCRLMVHEKCASLFDTPEITHPLHARHSLKLLTQGAPDYTKPVCHVCGRYTGDFLYHCDICKFNLDIHCAIESHRWHTFTPIALSNLKVHEHTLTLIPRVMFFVCDTCGRTGNLSPYVCFQCDLMFFHQDYARLPRLIHVNRHDHRVSYTYPLGRGKRECAVCLEEINWSYGAYSCSRCPGYALHSLCATRGHVWDGEELDGVPEEEDVEDLEPFKVNDDDTITHFAHEHNMSLRKDGIALEESILCGACVRPIGSCTFYSCSDCSFLLHETCANLPKKKRHILTPGPVTLCLTTSTTDTRCGACYQICCKGFVYTDGRFNYDLLCSSITVPFIHASHPHPLLFHAMPDYGGSLTCQGCRIGGNLKALGCIKCNYYLDFRCATLPLTVSPHRYYDHPLTLCFGEKASGKYWCDICEGETDPETWFYTSDYGATLHVFCVLGNVRYPKPGGKILGGDTALMFNNTSSRPLCNNCHFRCAAPYFLIKGNDLFCSYYCMLRIQTRASKIGGIFICPPWVDKPSMHLKM